MTPPRIFLVIVLFVALSYQKPVNCVDNNVSVLEVSDKPGVDCKSLDVCETYCAEFVPDCPLVYRITYHTREAQSVQFRPMFFEIQRNLTKSLEEAFQKTCVQMEYSSISLDLTEEVKKNLNFYLKAINVENKKVKKALKLTLWTWKYMDIPMGNRNFNLREFLNNGLPAKLKSQEVILKPLTQLKNTFTKQEQMDYDQVYDVIMMDIIDKLRVYGNNFFFNDISRISIKRYIRFIGVPNSSLKERYFGARIYDTIDRTLLTMNSFQKQCEKESKAIHYDNLVKFDNEKMKNSKEKYPFGPKSTFNWERDHNSAEFKHFLAFREKWFRAKGFSRQRCYCVAFETHYKLKIKEYKRKGMDPTGIIQERELQRNMIRKQCIPECERRKKFIQEFDVKSHDAVGIHVVKKSFK